MLDFEAETIDFLVTRS